MTSKKGGMVFFVCPTITYGPNRTQFQRASFLARSFKTVFLSNAPVAKEVARLAEDCFVCPGRRWHLDEFFLPLWAMWKVLMFGKGERQRGKGVIVYTTYHSIAIITGYLLKMLGHKWIADIWDHPRLQMEVNRVEKGLVGKLKYYYCVLLHIPVKRVLKKADGIVLALHPDAIAEYNIDSRKVLAITNGCDVELMKRRRAAQNVQKTEGGAFKLVYVGHVSVTRGLQVILDAARRLRRELPAVRFVLIGDCSGVSETLLQETVRKHDLTNISVLGELEHGRVLEELYSAGACLYPFPATHELRWIYPIKVFEYMSSGKPVIASDLPAIRTVLTHGRDALLFSPEDSAQLCACIKKVYKEKSFAALLGANARGRLRQFDWSLIHLPVIDLLKNVLGERG